MPKRKPKIIKDKKLRGEWAESVFMARAGEHSLPVSRPWGEMSSYDFVIGKTGRFVSVQVKSTISQLNDGYVCTVRGGHKAYKPGSFDFLAAYAVLADAWYIIPAPVIRRKEAIVLSPNLPTAKYEPYREAWHLLRDASEAAASESPSALHEPEQAERNQAERERADQINVAPQQHGPGQDEPVQDDPARPQAPIPSEPVSQFSPLSAFGRMEKAMMQIRDRHLAFRPPPPQPKKEA